MVVLGEYGNTKITYLPYSWPLEPNPAHVVIRDLDQLGEAEHSGAWWCCQLFNTHLLPSFMAKCFYLLTFILPDRVPWRNQLWQHHQVVLTLWRFYPPPQPQTGCLFLSGSPWNDFQVRTISYWACSFELFMFCYWFLTWNPPYRQHEVVEEHQQWLRD